MSDGLHILLSGPNTIHKIHSAPYARSRNDAVCIVYGWLRGACIVCIPSCLTHCLHGQGRDATWYSDLLDGMVLLVIDLTWSMWTNVLSGLSILPQTLLMMTDDGTGWNRFAIALT